MSNLFRDKVAGEKLLSIWWILVLIIVGVGISGGVVLYFSAHVDVRLVEADLLSDKVFRCFVNQGYLVDDFQTISFGDCGINENLFEGDSNYFLKVNFLDSVGNELRDTIIEGKKSFEEDCDIQKDGKIVARHFVKCDFRSQIMLYGEIKIGRIEIIAGSNQEGRIVPLGGL